MFAGRLCCRSLRSTTCRVWQLPLHSRLAASTGTPLPCSATARDPPARHPRPPSERAPSGRAAAACGAPRPLPRPSPRRPRSAPPARADAPRCRAQERRRLRMLHAVERVDGTMVARRSLGCCEVQRASRRGSRWLSRRRVSLGHGSRARAPICILSVLLCLLMSYYNTYELLY